MQAGKWTLPRGLSGLKFFNQRKAVLLCFVFPVLVRDGVSLSQNSTHDMISFICNYETDKTNLQWDR